MLQTLRSQSFSLTSKTAPFTSFLCFNGPHLIVECEGIFKNELVVHKKVFNEHWTNFFLMRPCIAHLHNVRVLCLWNFIWCRQSDRPSLANCWRKHWLLPSGKIDGILKQALLYNFFERRCIKKCSAPLRLHVYTSCLIWQLTNFLSWAS